MNNIVEQRTTNITPLAFSSAMAMALPSSSQFASAMAMSLPPYNGATSSTTTVSSVEPMTTRASARSSSGYPDLFTNFGGELRELTDKSSIPDKLKPFLNHELIYKNINFGPVAILTVPHYKRKVPGMHWNRVSPHEFRAAWLWTWNCGIMLTPIMTAGTLFDLSVNRWYDHKKWACHLADIGCPELAEITFGTMTNLINTMVANSTLYTYCGLPSPQAENGFITSAAATRVVEIRKLVPIPGNGVRVFCLPNGTEVTLPMNQLIGGDYPPSSRPALPKSITTGVDPEDAKAFRYNVVSSSTKILRYAAAIAATGLPCPVNRAGPDLEVQVFENGEFVWTSVGKTKSDKKAKKDKYSGKFNDMTNFSAGGGDAFLGTTANRVAYGKPSQRVIDAVLADFEVVEVHEAVVDEPEVDDRKRKRLAQAVVEVPKKKKKTVAREVSKEIVKKEKEDEKPVVASIAASAAKTTPLNVVFVNLPVDNVLLHQMHQLQTSPHTTQLVRTFMASQPHLQSVVASGVAGNVPLVIPIEMIPKTSRDDVVTATRVNDVFTLCNFGNGVVNGVHRIVKDQCLPETLPIGSNLPYKYITNDAAPFVERREQSIEINGVKTRQWGAVATRDLAFKDSVGFYIATFHGGGDHELDGIATAFMLGGVSEKDATDKYAIGNVEHSDTGFVGAASAAGLHISVLASANHDRKAANVEFSSIYNAARGGVEVFVSALGGIKKGQAILVDYGEDYELQSTLIGETLSGVVGPPADHAPAPKSDDDDGPAVAPLPTVVASTPIASQSLRSSAPSLFAFDDSFVPPIRASAPASLQKPRSLASSTEIFFADIDEFHVDKNDAASSFDLSSLPPPRGVNPADIIPPSSTSERTIFDNNIFNKPTMSEDDEIDFLFPAFDPNANIISAISTTTIAAGRKSLKHQYSDFSGGSFFDEFIDPLAVELAN